MKNKTNLSKENIERLLKDSKGTLISTSNGVVIEGSLTYILASFGMLVSQLSLSISKKQLEDVFKIGGIILNLILPDEKESKENAKSMIKDLTKSLIKNLQELLGDVDDDE